MYQHIKDKKIKLWCFIDNEGLFRSASLNTTYKIPFSSFSLGTQAQDSTSYSTPIKTSHTTPTKASPTTTTTTTTTSTTTTPSEYDKVMNSLYRINIYANINCVWWLTLY